MKRLQIILSVFHVFLLAVLLSTPVLASPAPDRGAPVAKKKIVTGIEWQVDPGKVVIFLDGKKLGDAESLKGKVSKTRPGKHGVKLINGLDETEMDIQVSKGQTLKFTFTFESE